MTARALEVGPEDGGVDRCSGLVIVVRTM
jgi:hypothetical protein